MKPDVSIIIPSYGQKKTILKTIKSIYDNKTNLKYEVIVVDSSPEDYTEYIKAKFPKVKVIHKKEKSICAKACNIGIRHAKADYILKTDSDVIVEDKWIEKLYERLKTYDIVGGSAGNANPLNLVGWSIYLTEFGSFLPTRKMKEQTDIMGCNMGFRKRIMKKRVYFKEIFSSEDLFFSHYYLMHGAKTIFDPDIKIKHINKSNIKSILKTQYMIGYYSAYARKKLQFRGKILVKYPLLNILIPIYRYFRILFRCILNPLHFILYLLVSPITIGQLITYSYGFYKGAID